MSIFIQLQDVSGDESLTSLYRDMIENGFGDRTPINWLTSQSSRPDILAGTWAFSKGMLLQGELPMVVKQMIASTISAHNNCNYCRELHGNTLSMLGVSEEIVASCVSDPELAAVRQPHKAILQFAIKAAKNPRNIEAGDMSELREQGVTESEVLEIVALSAFTNFINTWADITGLQSEPGDCA